EKYSDPFSRQSIIYEVETELRYKLDCSPDHIHLVYDSNSGQLEEKRTVELDTKSDFMVLQSGLETTPKVSPFANSLVKGQNGLLRAVLCLGCTERKGSTFNIRIPKSGQGKLKKILSEYTHHKIENV